MWERVSAIALTAVVAALSAVRMLHAGGLWRDEAGAARLATLPDLSEALKMFPHEAFPPLFLLTIRAYTRLVGGSDFALRGLGLGVGLGIVCILWLNARITARTSPLLSLALLGLAVPFLVFGDSVRGYGLGSLFICLTYVLLARAVATPSARRSGIRELSLAALTAMATIASVQLLLSNAALVLALCAAAAAVALARRRWWLAGWIAACGAAAAVSLLPYVLPLLEARRRWSFIVVYTGNARRILMTFATTLGPLPVMLIWLLLVAAGLLGIAHLLLQRAKAARASPVAARGTLPADGAEVEQERRRLDVGAFAALTVVGGLVANGLFLEILGYWPRSWYFLPLMAVLACALETIFGILAGTGIRWCAAMRIAAVVFLAAAQIVPLSRGAATRQTNIDLAARTLARSATPRDLIVVVPWFVGVSFDRYYRGAAPWLTLPEIQDHRFHRYDLLKSKLAAERPLDDLLAAVATTLRGGHRVWLAGAVPWPQPSEVLTIRPPAPRSPDGWHDYPYVVDWSRQLGRFLRSHSRRATTVSIPAGDPVSDLENLPVVVVEGWR